ncbi:MAG TPA: class I SAM-dependent methyltransferase [Candidatus Lokiarchaeia archaeon]|nr:class I SAM-dependent methyltransferase [Candidatus Lokiarchaeia archaeon]
MDYKDFLSGQTRNNFWSMAKRDLIDSVLSRFVKPAFEDRKSPSILNVGAGMGDDLCILNGYGVVTVVDIDKKALDVIPASSCSEKRVADILDLPYLNNSFDVVTCFDVFEHVQDDSRAFHEVHRVLKPGGLLVFTVPAFQVLFSGHDRILKHVRRYNRRMILARLDHFSIVFLSYWNCVLFLPVAARRILSKPAPSREDLVTFSRITNIILFHLLHLENLLLESRVQLPFGLSMVGICKKFENLR